MSYEQRQDSGVLFLNDPKTSAASPDYTGTYTGQDGIQRKIAAWCQVSKSGQPYLSLSLSDKLKER